MATNNNSPQPRDKIIQRGRQCSEANPIGLVSYYQTYQKKALQKSMASLPVLAGQQFDIEVC